MTTRTRRFSMATASQTRTRRKTRSCLHVLAWVAVTAGMLTVNPGAPAATNTYSILHTFSGAPGDGGDGGDALVTNSVIYGVSRSGGSNDDGTVYSLGIDGNGYQILHTFGSLPTDGVTPNGLQLLGSTLYGFTEDGGTSNNGTVYSIGASGNAYQILYDFGTTPGDGSNPDGLQLEGSVLYGTTSLGFGITNGTLFKFDTAGGGYHLLHTFGSITNDGFSTGAFRVSGSTIFGVTLFGGDDGLPGSFPVNRGDGTLYSIGTDGSNYRILHNFGSVPDDGALPISFEMSGSTIYAVTFEGGSFSNGTLYSIGTDGNNYQILHHFGSVTNDGIRPVLILPISGTTFYGSCASGGVNNAGTVFKFDTSGNTYQTIYSFTDTMTIDPGLIGIIGSTLYGATDFGGSSSNGSLFSIGTDGSNYQILHSFPDGPGDGYQFSGLELIGSTIYGLTSTGLVNSGVGFALTVSGGSGGSTNCTFVVDPLSAAPPAAGNSGTVSVTAPHGCDWMAASNDGFITITSGSSGSGNGTVHYTVAANASTNEVVGTMTIAGQTFTITQAGASGSTSNNCTFTVTPTTIAMTLKGGSKSVSVKTKDKTCAWTAVSNDDFITITSGASGTGNGKVTFTVPGNTNTTVLSGTITVAGERVTVNQAIGGCTFKLSPKLGKLKATGGPATIKVKANLTDCAWTATTTDDFITVTAGASGVGSGTVNYTVAPNASSNILTGSVTVAGQTFTIIEAGTK